MKKGLFALSPLMVFIAFYLVTSIVAGDFYKIPITVAFMVSSIYAIAAFRGKPLKKRIDLFSRGAATEQMVLMIWMVLSSIVCELSMPQPFLAATTLTDTIVISDRFKTVPVSSCFLINGSPHALRTCGKTGLAASSFKIDGSGMRDINWPLMRWNPPPAQKRSGSAMELSQRESPHASSGDNVSETTAANNWARKSRLSIVPSVVMFF